MEANTQHSSAEPVASTQPVTVFIVDDDIATRNFIKSVLEQERPHIKFTEIHDGLTALVELLNMESAPSLVILDIQMPKVNGHNIVQELRKRYHKNDLPIVMCTGTNNRALLMDLLQLGVNDMLLKPFDRFALLAKTLKYLGD